ncbi:MAG TPA: sensor histidine kinase [Clostridiaceae bacterium]|nr:sensor histidine kinase [Clostridiaceae bacterium]
MLKFNFLGSAISNINKNIRSNIKYKLFLVYVLVITVPIAVLGIISYFMSSRIIEKDYIEYKKRIDGQIVKNIDENINNLLRQSMAVYANIDDLVCILKTKDKPDTAYITSYNRLKSYFQSLLQGNNSIYGVSIISLNGEVKLYIDRYVGNINLFNVSKEPWFEETLAHNGYPILLEPHEKKFVSKDNFERNLVISLSRAIIDLNSDEICGIIMIDQDISKFSGIVTNVEVDDDEKIVVYGKSGSIVYSNSKFTDEQYKEIFSLSQISHSQPTKTVFDGHAVILNSGESKEFGWKVVSMLPVSTLRKKSSFIGKINFTLLAILVVITFIISNLSSTLVTKPLKILANSFKKLKKGDFNTSVPVKGSDELAQISADFNDTVASIKSLIREKYEYSLLRKQAELELLQSQINPHFLFNTLNSIKAVSDAGNMKQCSIMIKSLSDMFRYSLNKGKYIIKFSEELDIVKRYIFLQQCRFGDKYNVTWDIDERVMDYGIVRLTLQPIVENAIYHGLENKRGVGDLQITARLAGSKYLIFIADNGAGIGETELEKINCILEKNPDESANVNPEKLGIYNVNARIKFHFGNEYGLKIYRLNGFTTVKIALPAKNFDYSENKSACI